MQRPSLSFTQNFINAALDMIADSARNMFNGAALIRSFDVLSGPKGYEDNTIVIKGRLTYEIGDKPFDLVIIATFLNDNSELTIRSLTAEDSNGSKIPKPLHVIDYQKLLDAHQTKSYVVTGVTKIPYSGYYEPKDS